MRMLSKKSHCTQNVNCDTTNVSSLCSCHVHKLCTKQVWNRTGCTTGNLLCTTASFRLHKNNAVQLRNAWLSCAVGIRALVYLICFLFDYDNAMFPILHATISILKIVSICMWYWIIDISLEHLAYLYFYSSGNNFRHLYNGVFLPFGRKCNYLLLAFFFAILIHPPT